MGLRDLLRGRGLRVADDQAADSATPSKRDLRQVIEWLVWWSPSSCSLIAPTSALSDEHAWIIPAAAIPALVSTVGSNIELMLRPAGGYGSKDEIIVNTWSDTSGNHLNPSVSYNASIAPGQKEVLQLAD